MLARLYFKSHESSKWLCIPLRQENYLIGPNGSGKSTVLRHISQVSSTQLTSNASDGSGHESNSRMSSGDGFNLISLFRFDLTGGSQLKNDSVRNLLLLISGRIEIVARGDELTLMQPIFEQRLVSRRSPSKNLDLLAEVVGGVRRGTSKTVAHLAFGWLCPLDLIQEIGLKHQKSDEAIAEAATSLFIISNENPVDSSDGPISWVAGIAIPEVAIRDLIEDQELLESRTKSLQSVEANGSHMFEGRLSDDSGGGGGNELYFDGSTYFLPLAGGEWKNASQSLMDWLNIGQMTPLLLDEPKSSTGIEFEILQAVMVMAGRIEATLTKSGGLNPRYQGIGKTFADTQARWLRNVYGEGMTSLRIRPEVEAAVALLNSLIEEFLPDFLSDIRGRVQIPDLT